MIPYFQINAFLIGPITIQVWGLLVSIGILSGLALSYYLARKYFLSGAVITDLVLWLILGGLFGARVFHILFYDPVYYLTFPIETLYFWQGGASSLGGFFGAAIALYIFFRRRHFAWGEIKPYLDIITPGLWLGWGIGRIGCFLIHDHIGRSSNSFLAVQFPGGSRFDLGLLESLLAFVLFILSFLNFKRIIKLGWSYVFVGSFLIYAIVRFFLDFLRATDLSISDPRYWFLTPSQWGMCLFGLALTFYIVWSRMKQQKNIGRIE